MKFLSCIILWSTLLNASLLGVAKADDWGCEVLLCLSNPKGATAVAPCVPPIKRLWRELSKGKPFPICFMGGSKDSGGNGAEHRFASGNYCPENYVIPAKGFHGRHCALSGAVTVYSNGRPTQRVWWGGEESFTEPLDGSVDSGPRDSEPEQLPAGQAQY